MNNNETIRKFVGDQLSRWPLACDNFRALKNVRVREMDAGGLTVRLQFNPARMISSAARLDKADIAKRKCFLCRDNRPAEQIMLKFEGRKNKKYHVLVNPYPIFPDHLVIASDRHTDQSIWQRYIDMLDLARKYDGFTFFYNGPKSGASAPDHHHFQAAPKGLIPLQEAVDALLDGKSLSDDGFSWTSDDLRYVTSVRDADLYHYRKFTTGVFVLRSDTAKSAAKLFYRLLDCAEKGEGEAEPQFNLFTYWIGSEFRSIVIFRSRHRSHHYFSEGPDHLTMSPGCADMGGVFIVPVEAEYEKMTPELLNGMIAEVSVTKEYEDRLVWRLTRTQPFLSVGIMSAKEIEFEILSDGAGLRKAILREGKIEYDGALYDELYFEASTLSTQFAEPSFVLYGVTIGIGFHWERKENQRFAGALRIIVDRDRLTAVNVVGVEDYLLSVISSEMSASASEEFLKAHAVISRSWVMAQIASSERRRPAEVPEGVHDVPSLVSDLDARFNGVPEDKDGHVHEYVRWYDHEDHSLFDVCADDHCQRYQGLTRATGDTVRRVIDATWGQILTYEGMLCDARFSKCCGGRMETFGTCWDDIGHPYLRALPDSRGHSEDSPCFCDTQDKDILGQVLNNYDRETVDFYRWTQKYSIEGLSELVSRRSGVEIGRMESIEALERGGSGRICKLQIKGTLKTLVVGKELEIRKILSESHLKSSAFDVEMTEDSVILYGKGWGHGVGLCQIGAAVMASEGYDYKTILQHYYPGTEIS